MLDVDATELSSVKERLGHVIGLIVARHRSAGHALTWRLLYAIEKEAFLEIQSAKDINPIIVDMMHTSPLFQFPCTDEPVDFGESNALPAAFYLIQEAYRQTH